MKAAKGKVKLAKMNIDEHPAIPGQMGIQSIPAVIAFVNGQPADGFMGALPEARSSPFSSDSPKANRRRVKRFAQGRRRSIGRGNAAAAADIYAQLLTEDGGNVAALAGLARCYVQTGALEQAKTDACHGAGSQAQRHSGCCRARGARACRAGKVRRTGR